MNEIKLKPCPFCGHAAHIVYIAVYESPYFVECDNEFCVAKGNGIAFKTEKEAAEAWNKRTGEGGAGMTEKILEEIDRLDEPYYKDYVDRKHVVEIIRSHMDNEDNDDWIPVEERLPNKEEFLEAYCRNKYAAEFIVMIEGATKPTTLYFKNGKWFDDNLNYYNVTAWQPLPKPYKPKELQTEEKPVQ